MFNPEFVLQRVGDLPVFDNQDHGAGNGGIFSGERPHLIVSSGATRTLRAMLEKHDWFFLRTFEEGDQILLFAKFKYHQN